MLLNALTFDIEEYFHAHAFEAVVDHSALYQYQSRVVRSTDKILNLLSEFNVKATFFILGSIANRYPSLVQEISSEGHEIGSHGYQHELVYRQSPSEFCDDLQRSIEAIGVSCHTPIVGYRAPGFSITRRSLWALDILKSNGILYDSSIFPLAIHDRYGIRDADRFAWMVRDGLWEFPVSTLRIFKYNWPIAGGGYFRLFPLCITRDGISRINAEGQPGIVYLHPWEFDPGQPRFTNAPLLSLFRHYVNLNKTEERLRSLLEQFRFAPMRTVFSKYLEAS